MIGRTIFKEMSTKITIMSSGDTNTIGGVPSARGIVAILGTLLIFNIS